MLPGELLLTNLRVLFFEKGVMKSEIPLEKVSGAVLAAAKPATRQLLRIDLKHGKSIIFYFRSGRDPLWLPAVGIPTRVL